MITAHHQRYDDYGNELHKFFRVEIMDDYYTDPREPRAIESDCIEKAREHASEEAAKHGRSKVYLFRTDNWTLVKY